MLQTKGMGGRWEVSDLQWAILSPSLEPKPRADGKGRPPADTRAVLNGVLWILGTGAQWREMQKTSDEEERGESNTEDE